MGKLYSIAYAAFSGLWEIPQEAVYSDHEVQLSGLNKQPQWGFP